MQSDRKNVYYLRRHPIEYFKRESMKYFSPSRDGNCISHKTRPWKKCATRGRMKTAEKTKPASHRLNRPNSRKRDNNNQHNKNTAGLPRRSHSCSGVFINFSLRRAMRTPRNVSYSRREIKIFRRLLKYRIGLSPASRELTRFSPIESHGR